MGRLPLGEMAQSRMVPQRPRRAITRSCLRITRRSMQPSKRRPNGLYDVLQLDPSCSMSMVLRQFRKLSLSCHPDKMIGEPAHKKSVATKKFNDLMIARDTLSDPHMRLAYDRQVLKNVNSTTRAPSDAIPTLVRVRVHRMALSKVERQIVNAITVSTRAMRNKKRARQRCGYQVAERPISSTNKTVNRAWKIWKRSKLARKSDRRLGPFEARQ